MAQQFNNKKKIFIIVSVAVILIGLLSLVLAFGLSDGWQAVAEWFASDSAIVLYVFLGTYGLITAWILISDRIKRL